jgi:hypothetical protein
MSKMGLHSSFKHLKHKLWPKEGPGVELTIWFSTTKVRNQPLPDIWFGNATWRWKALDKSYNFALDHIAIRGLFVKLWGSKVPGVPFGTISGLPLGSPEKNSHLDVGFVENHKIYYKGEGGSFPQVWAVVSLVCSCCPWLVLAPRVLQLCTNHFVWVMCKPMWVTKACQLFLVPSRSSNMPLYLSKCCELGGVLRLLLFRCFLLGLTFEPFKELRVRQNISSPNLFQGILITSRGANFATLWMPQMTTCSTMWGFIPNSCSNSDTCMNWITCANL